MKRRHAVTDLKSDSMSRFYMWQTICVREFNQNKQHGRRKGIC